MTRLRPKEVFGKFEFRNMQKWGPGGKTPAQPSRLGCRQGCRLACRHACRLGSRQGCRLALSADSGLGAPG